MNHMQNTSKVRGDGKAAFKNKRPAHKGVKDRAECNPKPSWKGQKPLSKKK